MLLSNRAGELHLQIEQIQSAPGQTAGARAMAKPKVAIKKYGDRRLYDTLAKRYVKLDDIARMVREGQELEVRDARSGKDLTCAVLTQIVMEDAREGQTILPLQLLQQIVMASDRATREFLTSYLHGTLELYGKAREAFESGLSGARQAVTNPVEFVRSLVGKDAEIAQLRRRVEELEARLALADRPRRKPRRRKMLHPPPLPGHPNS